MDDPALVGSTMTELSGSGVAEQISRLVDERFSAYLAAHPDTARHIAARYFDGA
jgi:hypothetical protein